MDRVVTTAHPGPLTEKARIEAMDVARGAAILGILIMNIWAFGGPQAFFDYPLAIADRAGAPVATWAVIHTLFEGSQRTLLSLLFGAGALIIITRLEAQGEARAARRAHYRRTLALSAFGLVNAYLLLWPADILFVYGLAGLCLYPLRRLRNLTLLAIALAVLMVPTTLRVARINDLEVLAQTAQAALDRQAAGTAPDEADRRAIDDWQAVLDKARPRADDDKIVAGIRAMQSGTPGEIIARQARSSLILQTIVAAKWWFFDALAMMIVGMVLYRSGILTGSLPWRSSPLALAGVGFAIGLPLALWQTTRLLASDFHPVDAQVVKLGYDLRRLAMAIGWLGLTMAWCSSPVASGLRHALAATGRMALTNYLTQSILCALVFYAFGLGLYGRLTGWQLYYVMLPLWALQMTWSVWWLHHFRLGPAEWLWRRLSYDSTPPWRRLPAARPQPAATGQ